MKIWGDDFNGDSTVLDGEEEVRFSNQQVLSPANGLDIDVFEIAGPQFIDFVSGFDTDGRRRKRPGFFP